MKNRRPMRARPGGYVVGACMCLAMLGGCEGCDETERTRRHVEDLDHLEREKKINDQFNRITGGDDGPYNKRQDGVDE